MSSSRSCSGVQCPNVALAPLGRGKMMVLLVVEEGWRVAVAAERFQLNP